METLKKVGKWLGIALLILIAADLLATYVPLPAPVKAIIKAPVAFIKGLFGGGNSASA